MAEFTNSAIHPMLDWLTGIANPAAVATRYVTIFNGDPTGAGSEVINTVTGSSNRQDLTTAMAAASGGQAVSDTLITFTTSAVGGATVNFLAIYSAITGGTLLAYTPITSKTIAAGDGLSVPIGNLTIAIT